MEDFYKEVGHSRQYLSRLFSGLTPLNDELAKKINETFDRVSADLIRNRSRADTATADNLALFYSLYKTAQMHGVEFETYMRKAISVMTEHMSEIEFEKDNRGTIIGYKSDSISKEVLESVMPWNLHI
nr:helix-turn-helix transcriptional regulator [Succinivibrio dextrinosolvens]